MYDIGAEAARGNDPLLDRARWWLGRARGNAHRGQEQMAASLACLARSRAAIETSQELLGYQQVRGRALAR